MAADRYLLVKGIAGMGNRVLSLLTAVLYARLSHRRLLVDWSDPAYSSDGSNVVHRFFTSPLFGVADQIPETTSVRPAIWRGHLHESALEMRTRYAPALAHDPLAWQLFSVELSKLDHPEEVLVMWAYIPLIGRLRRHLRGEFAGLRALETEVILRRLMRESLELHATIRQRVDDLRRNWPAGPVVGIHARNTDKVTSVRAIRDKLEQLRAQQRDAAVFLATDSQSLEQSFAREIPGMITAPKWYPVRGERLHYNSECEDRSSIGAEALVDLHLLASCDELVLDTSSAFALLAAILSDVDGSRVHDVRKWGMLPPKLRNAAWWVRETVKWAPQRLFTRLRM